MKKSLAIILALVLALGVFSAAVAEDGVYTDENGYTYKVFDDVKLTALSCWNGGKQVPDDQYGNEVATQIREKIGVTVEFEGIMMSETEKLNMMFASGDMPDIVNAPYWGGNGGETAVIKKAAADGMLIDLKDLVPQYPNIADAYDIGVISQLYLERDIDYPEAEGARYVLPQQVAGDDADITNWCYGVFVRGDVPTTLGVDPATITTPEALYDFMKQAQEYGFKDINGNDCIIATTFHNGWSYGNFTEGMTSKQLTSYSLGEDGKVTYSPLTDTWMNRNLFIWRLVNEGMLDVECFTTNDDLANEKVGNGTALFTCAQYGMSINATKLTGLYDSNPEMRYVPVGPMTYADGQPLVQIEANGRTGSPVLIFPYTCSNIDAALTYIDYMNSQEGVKLARYGFEGDTYELNADGQPRMNAELTAQYKEDSTTVNNNLRQRGIGGYIFDTVYVAKKCTAWYGESNPFDAEAANEYQENYKKLRPVEKLPGYPITAIVSGFEGYNEMAEWAFDSEKESSYTERAFFAATEEEARAILEEYRTYLTTNEGGKFMEFLDYVTEQYGTRDDFVF